MCAADYWSLSFGTLLARSTEMGSLPNTVWVLEACLSWVSGSLPEQSFARSLKAFLQATAVETAHPQSYAPKWMFTGGVVIAGLLPRGRFRGCSLSAQLIGWGHTAKFQENLKSTLLIFLPSKMNLTSQRWRFMFREKVGGILMLCSTQWCFKTLGCALDGISFSFFFFLVWKLLSHVQLFVTPWTVAHRVSLSMEFSRLEYWSG